MHINIKYVEVKGKAIYLLHESFWGKISLKQVYNSKNFTKKKR